MTLTTNISLYPAAVRHLNSYVYIHDNYDVWNVVDWLWGNMMYINGNINN
jgi:hypothetical protein